ncbi:hypothetical protein [uncultured Sphingomonas sp.]
MASSIFPKRYVENLAGSLLSAVIGFGIIHLPEIIAIIGSRRDRVG